MLLAVGQDAERPPDGDDVPEPLPEQKKFIERAPGQHGLLVAGPGTGKTWTIERRIENLVKNGVEPDRISAVTLTRAMAQSLSDRIPYGKAQTLHSFALSQLNKLGEAWGRRVVDPWEQANFVIEDLRLGANQSFGATHSVTAVKRFLERLSTAFRDDQSQPSDMSAVEARLFEVFQHQRELFKYRLMDELVFDLSTLLDQGVELAKPPTHIVADEYQDFTAGELRLLALLKDKVGTIVAAAGDDRQSIFGFRSADPLALHRFPQAYGLEEVDYLSSSRRCPQAVCDFAEAVSQDLPELEGIDRPTLSPWDGRTDPGLVRIVVAPSPIGEARWIVSECLRLVEAGVPRSSIMVVACRFIGEVRAELDVAVAEVEGAPFAFYDPRLVDPAADDVAARLTSAAARLLLDGEDHMAWRALVGATPQLGEARLVKLLTAGETDYLRNLRRVAEGDPVCARPFTAGTALIERYGDAEEFPAIDAAAFLSQELGIPGLDLSILAALVEELGEAQSPSDWLQQIFEVSQTSQIAPEERPSDIAVRTIFGAKGLEAPVVFVCNALQHSFTGRGDVADGLRQLYVAATRSSDQLYISACRYLGYSRLSHAVGSKVGGLAGAVTRAADRVGAQAEIL